MKILYLHQYFKTPQNSGGCRSYSLAKRLVNLGFEVNMVTADCSTDNLNSRIRKESIDGINVYWLPVPYNNSMGFYSRIKAFFKFAFFSSLLASKIGGDVVFATSTPLTIAIPGILSSLFNRIPMVFEVRDVWPAVPIAIGALKNPILKAMARGLEVFTYRWASHIVALAPGMKEDVVATGVPESKVTVIPNGCDMDLFNLNDEFGLKVRNANAWLGDRPMIVYTGTMGMANGVEYLIRLAQETQKINEEICFVVIGKGKEEAKIKVMADNAGILNKNFFMLGVKPRQEIPFWLSAADMAIALLTGPRVIWKDATQNKFFDALAAGCPYAGNFDGWQTQIAVENDIGIYLDPDDASKAASKLVAALSSKAWLKNARKKAKELGATRFNRDTHATLLAKIFTQVKDNCNVR